MELTPYVDRLRNDLTDAAAAGGAETRAAAERLMLALDPATRMVLLEALAQATAEISGELDHETVDVRITGREPEFVVTRLAAADLAPQPPPADAEPPDDDNQSRVTLRLPESVKTRAEERAGRVGQSLNAWLVEAVREALAEARTSGPTSPTYRTDGPRKRIRGWVS